VFSAIEFPAIVLNYQFGRNIKFNIRRNEIGQTGK